MKHPEYVRRHAHLLDGFKREYAAALPARAQSAARGAINRVLVACLAPGQVPTEEEVAEAMTAFTHCGVKGLTPGVLADWAYRVTAPRMELSLIGKIAETRQKMEGVRDVEARQALADRITRLRKHQINLQVISGSLDFLRVSRGEPVPA